MKPIGIILNRRHYPLLDEGEGEAFIYLHHQQVSLASCSSIIAQYLKNQERVFFLDVSENYPKNIEKLTIQEHEELIDDIHLLVDIYWLDRFGLGGNYINEVIRYNLKHRLGCRYRA
ncbi:hypothetical protein [Shewanella sp. UCD-KL12]|uniref:hypothetical protein n=1 Tax=Shewanella sp. UCD-KL12 TaxID=1917163 RepID=UPI00097042A7|nr:hypothetical protein [Shewanella sp. UCD-KL12]